MKKKGLFLLLAIMTMLVGCGYQSDKTRKKTMDSVEIGDSVKSEDPIVMDSMKTSSLVDEFINGGWTLDTICMTDAGYIYAGYADCFSSRIIFSDKELFVEDPNLEIPGKRVRNIDSCTIRLFEKTLLIDFRDSTSVAQLSAWGKMMHPEVIRFRKDTLVDVENTIRFFLTVDFPNSSHEKAKEIEEWLMDIGYEEMMVDTTAAIAKDKDEWWNILAGKFIQDMSWGEAELWPSKTFEVIDLRTRIFTDKYVTCQKYMIRYTGGAHEYYKESLHSYDYIHQKKMDWEYLFEEQFRKNVWELLCEAALENEKYKTCFADDNLEDVKIRLEHEMELGLVEDGIVFSYQPYQIGSFADGTFHFIVPYYKLNPYMTDKAKWCLNGI